MSITLIYCPHVPPGVNIAIDAPRHETRSVAKLVTKHNEGAIKKSYMDKTEHWRYCSARNYLGDTGLFEVERVW